MTEYSELVKALRCENHPCKECEYILWFEDEDANAYTCDEDRLHHDAADAIEALQAQLPKRGEIVRCGECKHYNAGFECLAEGYGIERDPDWFCADGEREVQE